MPLELVFKQYRRLDIYRLSVQFLFSCSTQYALRLWWGHVVVIIRLMNALLMCCERLVSAHESAGQMTAAVC